MTIENNLQPTIENQPLPDFFDYTGAAEIAHRKVELSGSDDKLGKAEVKRRKKDFCAKYPNHEAAFKIFELEEKKQSILIKREILLLGLGLNSDLKFVESEHEAIYSPREKGFTINNKFISEEEIFTDINWGKVYNLSASTPVELKNQYLEEVFEHQYNELYNRQLVIDRVKIEDKLDQRLEDTYGRVEKAFDNKEEERSAGLMFEKMLYNLVYKFGHHFKKYGLKIERLTVIDDVENKIDFVISLPKKNRGVGIEEINDEKLGVQFTLVENYSPKYNFKKRQVEKAKKNIKDNDINDLVLISIPVNFKEIFDSFGVWDKNGRPAGGPEKNLSAKTKIMAVEGIMKKTELAENNEFKNDLKQFFESH